MADPTFAFKVGDKSYKVDLNDFTGTDARKFRLAVGMSLATALAKVGTGELDPLEFVAGFKWLKDLADDPDLTFEKVLDGLTYESVDLDPDAEEEEEDPPTHGGDSESNSPPSPISSDSSLGTSTTSPSVSSVST